MTHRRFVPMTFAASAVLLLAALAPGVAYAQSACEANSDCEMGFECTVVATSGCASAGAAAPAPTCPPGQTCDAPAPQPEPPCVTTEQKACTPAHCTSDAQCATGMVCHAYPVPCAVTNCACPPNTDCYCPMPVCDPATVSTCTPRYALPCTQAADCGEGFDCVEQLSGGCGSSGGAEGKPAPDPAPGFAPLPPEGAGGQPAEEPLPTPDPIPQPPECTVEPSGVFQCIPLEILCDAASDCPAGWTCVQESQGDRPACGGAGCPEPEPLPPARRLCQPEYYGGGVGIDQGGTPASGGPKGGTGTATPEASPTPTDDADAHESAACQMGHAPASSGALALLAMLGALLGLKRRRA